MGVYSTIITRVFENSLADSDTDQELMFTREDLDKAVQETDVDICCPPDVPYAYRAGRDLPDEIQEQGFTGIELAEDGPVYKFTR